LAICFSGLADNQGTAALLFEESGFPPHAALAEIVSVV
jgi:hypothetical protein